MWIGNTQVQAMTLACLRAVLCGVVLAVATAQPQYPPLPGMLTASGAFGAQFARGYDPVLGDLKAPTIDFHYTVRELQRPTRSTSFPVPRLHPSPPGTPTTLNIE